MKLPAMARQSAASRAQNYLQAHVDIERRRAHSQVEGAPSPISEEHYNLVCCTDANQPGWATLSLLSNIPPLLPGNVTKTYMPHHMGEMYLCHLPDKSHTLGSSETFTLCMAFLQRQYLRPHDPRSNVRISAAEPLQSIACTCNAASLGQILAPGSSPATAAHEAMPMNPAEALSLLEITGGRKGPMTAVDTNYQAPLIITLLSRAECRNERGVSWGRAIRG
jgi:hypothetical protein